jgi:hypothetical protein
MATISVNILLCREVTSLEKMMHRRLSFSMHELDLAERLHIFKISWKVSKRSMDTMDFLVFCGTRLRTGKLDYRTHQKLENRYTFLPFSSLRSVWTKKAAIKAEVTRHATNCS